MGKLRSIMHQKHAERMKAQGYFLSGNSVGTSKAGLQFTHKAIFAHATLSSQDYTILGTLPTSPTGLTLFPLRQKYSIHIQERDYTTPDRFFKLDTSDYSLSAAIVSGVRASTIE